MNDTGKLSLCMIVRDEERWLARCLGSVREAVDEMIVVDTGSADRSKQIALSFGAAVYDCEWRDNFAEARNYGLERATGDWVMWLDADEEVEKGEAARLRDVLSDRSGALLGGVRLVNYYGSSPPDYNRSHLLTQYRLFRRSAAFRFRNAIHEQLNTDGADMTEASAMMLPVTVHHYGYLDETVNGKRKLMRNLRLLEREKRNGGAGPWVDYHIASEFYRAEAFAEAFKFVNLSIGGFLEQGLMPPSLLYKLKYSILLGTAPGESAAEGIELAIRMYPDYVDLHFCKGLLLLGMKRVDEALSAFQHCIELGDNGTPHLVTVGAGSFRAYCGAGRCHLENGNRTAARAAFEQALRINPHCEEAAQALERLAN